MQQIHAAVILVSMVDHVLTKEQQRGPALVRRLTLGRNAKHVIKQH